MGSCDDAPGGPERCINGRLYRADRYLHVARLGDVQERTLDGIDHHPYHQHMHPFQLMGGAWNGQSADDYFRPGDWQCVVAAFVGRMRAWCLLRAISAPPCLHVLMCPRPS